MVIMVLGDSLYFPGNFYLKKGFLKISIQKLRWLFVYILHRTSPSVNKLEEHSSGKLLISKT